MPKIREFLSIEQALIHALESLTDEDLKQTKKKKITFRDYADPDKYERNLTLRDAIEVDAALMKKNKGHPLLDTYNSILDIQIHGDNPKPKVERTLITMGERVGKLMGEVEKSMSEDSDSGEKISKEEKDKIYKAIKELEAKITSLKKSIE